MTFTLPSSKQIMSHVCSYKQYCTRKNLIKAKLFILGGFVSHRGVFGVLKGALAGVGILGLTMMHKPADMGNMQEIAVCGNNKIETVELCDGSKFNKSLKLADPSAWMCSDTCQITLKDDQLIQELTAPVVIKKPVYAKTKITTTSSSKTTIPVTKNTTTTSTETLDDLAIALTQDTTTKTTTTAANDDDLASLIQALSN